jgi:tRNA threonylcarbamoyladenosine biosynthesis protein TsaB
LRILALDSSSWWGGVALLERPLDDGPCRTIVEVGLQVAVTHAESLLTAIDQALALASWERHSLDGFVATRGPGSFTGIRIGLGTIRGLGLAADRPCAGVSTLDALAEAHGPAEADRLALISAGREEIFGARYPADTSPAVPVSGPWLRPLERWRDATAGEAVAVAIPGPGSESAVRRMGVERSGIRVSATPTSVAAAAGRLALAAGVLCNADEKTMVPLYLRLPDAELEAPST